QDMCYELELGQIANDCKTKNRTQRKNEIEIAACGMYGKLSNSKYGAFLIEHDTKAQEITYGGNQSVDIVIPVYNGYEFLPKLFEGIRRTAVQYRLFIVDDCSPDERIYPYLESIKEANTVLIKNEKNVGFVMSVNAALAQTENDVVLLNTDVELPPFWLERLMNPIFTDDRVATATPFTNSGTICSFPCIGTDNPIMEGLSVDEMDKAFQTIEPIYTVMPTGVGFCMAMSRQAINQIGLLDEQAFEKGYGEENDWCQRAIAAGYKNVMVENLFAYHKHGGSFLSDEKKRLIERNQKILQERYPRYRYEVAEYFSQDPLKYLRNWIALNILSAATKKSPRLIWNHGIGGGADAYIRKEIERDTKLGKQSILAWYDVYSGYYIAEYCYKNYQLRFFAREIDSLTRLFDLTGVDEVVINELVSYPDIIHTLELILQIKEKHGSQLVILMHDFFAVCPCCTLLNAQDTFCNVPQNLLVCN
ncbi:MAG: glycosyltransferase, partial [Christensenellaceae bacterium]